MHLAFTRLYHAYRGEDPASEPQLALPLKVFLGITEVEGKSADPLEQALADFVTIAFYFLLRVGEYTSSASTKKDTHCPDPAERRNLLARTAHWADVPLVTRCAPRIAPSSI
jgi:hypothetical protein